MELWLKIPVENIQSNSTGLIQDSKVNLPNNKLPLPHADNSDTNKSLINTTSNRNGYIDRKTAQDVPNLKQENPKDQENCVNIKIEKENHIEAVPEQPASVVPPPANFETNLIKSTTVPVVTPAPQLRPGKLVKCLDTKGNIIMVELRVDPNNPKNIQIIRTGNPSTVNPAIAAAPLNRPAEKPTPSVPHVQNGMSSVTNQALSSKQSSTAAIIKIAKPKQESLLKPQISLLKPQPFFKSTPPIPKCQSGNTLISPIVVPIASLNQSILLKRPSPMTPTKRFQVKQVFMKKNMDQPRNYRNELNMVFFDRSRFHSIRSAVEFLLKKIPIINPKISHDERNYVQHFPFSVNSETAFNRLSKVKQHLCQWYQAKCINRMIHKHSDLTETPKWTTKEIVIFARQFGYMQLDASAISSSSASDTMKMFENKNKISISSEICDWIDDWYRAASLNADAQRTTHGNSDLVEIDVENDDVKSETSVKRNTAGSNVGIPMDSYLQKECTWITDACTSIEIDIKQEGSSISYKFV